MTKKLLFLSAAVLLLAAACAKKAAVNSQTSVESNSQTSAQQQTASGGQSSLKELMALGSSQKCQVSYSTNGAQSQGTIFLSGGKMRGDFTATVNGKAQTSHMIIMDKTSYVWVEGMATGFKMQAESTNSNSQNKPQASVDPNAKYNYQCSSWVADSSEFNLPATINFSDVSAMMKSTTGTGTSGTGASAGASGSASLKAQQCAACDSLSGNSKTQCRSALSCP